jgi:hypothetical protein
MRQKLLDPSMLEVKGTPTTQINLACAWHEPFVLYYERALSKTEGGSPQKP